MMTTTTRAMMPAMMATSRDARGATSAPRATTRRAAIGAGGRAQVLCHARCARSETTTVRRATPIDDADDDDARDDDDDDDDDG